ncbi:MAG: hypothetical protein F6J94_25920 [Moorea sp. SIO1F2]|nr:hypothetical protein [Moorena sp. SIO1F2]NET85224.1 hypothetical protein [Moorena sp. SIO1F2]
MLGLHEPNILVAIIAIVNWSREMGRWGDEEIGRWGDGEMGRWRFY